MTSFERVRNMFSCPQAMAEFAKNHDYGKDEIEAITCEDEDEYKFKCPITYKYVINDACHRSDERRVLAFVRNIIPSWIVENTLVDGSGDPNGRNKKLKLNGADKDRIIAAKGRISTSCDFIFNNDMNVELILESNNQWETERRTFLRDNKYNSLVAQKAVIIGVSLRGYENKFMLIDLSKPRVATKAFQFSKNGYDLDLSGVEFENLSSKAVTERLQEIYDKRKYK